MFFSFYPLVVVLSFSPFFLFLREKNYFSQPDIHNNLHIVIAVTINRHAHTLSDLIYESKQPKKNKNWFIILFYNVGKSFKIVIIIMNVMIIADFVLYTNNKAMKKNSDYVANSVERMKWNKNDEAKRAS